jgi:DNA-binding transcriptional LysR family regulator
VWLLNRTTRRVSLTEIGQEYYEWCSQILHELQEADEVASALQVTPRGRLRVYCHQGPTRFIALVVAGLLEDYPEVSLDLRSGDALIDLVQEGFDLAIMPFFCEKTGGVDVTELVALADRVAHRLAEACQCCRYGRDMRISTRAPQRIWFKERPLRSLRLSPQAHSSVGGFGGRRACRSWAARSCPR